MGYNLPSLPDITKICPFVIRILGQNPGSKTLQGTNSYLIGHENREKILIDTTSSGEGLQKYVELIKRNLPAENDQISDIIITHWHPDHVGGINSILELAKALWGPKHQILIHKFEQESAPSLKSMKIRSENLHSLCDGQTFKLEDNIELTVKFTPGHASDHVCLLLSDNSVPKYLFTGDIILGHGSTVVENLPHYMESLTRIKNLIMRFDTRITILPAHGDKVDDALAKVDEYISNRQSRITKCENYLRQSKNVTLDEAEILKFVYPETPKELEKAALLNLRHSLFFIQSNSQQFGLNIPQQDGTPITYEEFVKEIQNPENLASNNPLLGSWTWERSI